MSSAAEPLPAEIPLFPLPNAVLFPGVPLPLHIFEPRYRDMVRDAREGHGLIGMVLLRGDWRESYNERPEIFSLGCAGRMVRCDALADGRYNIVLHGLREFRIRAEVEDGATTYRRAEVAWRDPPADGLSAVERARVRTAMTRYLEPREPSLARRLLAEPAMSDETLVNFLCQSLDFSPIERQSLLEAAAICNRAARLCEVIEFALGSGGFDGAGTIH